MFQSVLDLFFTKNGLSAGFGQLRGRGGGTLPPTQRRENFPKVKRGTLFFSSKNGLSASVEQLRGREGGEVLPSPPPLLPKEEKFPKFQFVFINPSFFRTEIGPS